MKISVLFLSVVHEKRRSRYMKAKEFDAKFDEGRNIIDVLDLSKARRSMQKQKCVNVDFPS